MNTTTNMNKRFMLINDEHKTISYYKRFFFFFFEIKQ